METPEMELPGTQMQAIGARENKDRDSDISDEHALDAEARDCEAQEHEACAGAARVSEPQVNGGALEEDETQLAAIREFMTRASSRGIWLTLTEIAEATEFAEASISAQLRHLRKPGHGAHRGEKRRRGRARAAGALRKSRHARRGPVIWEYRVSAGRCWPHGH